MVSFGLGILQNLGLMYILTALLIFALVFGALSQFEIFGKNQWVNALIAVVISLFFISMAKTIIFVKTLVPFMIGLVLVIMLILLIFRFIGIEGGTIAGALKGSFMGYGLIILIILILIVVSLQITAPELFAKGEVNESSPTYQMQETVQTLFHPAVLGVIILLVMFMAAIWFLLK